MQTWDDRDNGSEMFVMVPMVVRWLSGDAFVCCGGICCDGGGAEAALLLKGSWGRAANCIGTNATCATVYV